MQQPTAATRRRRWRRRGGAGLVVPGCQAAAGRLWAGVAALLGGDLQGVFDVEEAAERAETLGLGWVARLSRAALVLTQRPGSAREAEGLRAACARDGDRWGSALIGRMGGGAAFLDGAHAAH